MYILVKQEISNGFEHTPEVLTFDSFDSAYEIYQEKVQEAAKEFDGCTPITNYKSDNEMSIFFDEENMKGNGLFILLIENKTATEKVMRALDESKEEFIYTHVGLTGAARYPVPMKYIDSNSPVQLTSDMRGRVAYIIRRPEDPADRFSTDYIYDVYCKTDKLTTYVESLETISTEALVDIILNLS